MSNESKYLLRNWAKNPVSRRSLFGAAIITAISSTSIGKAFGVTAPVITKILGRPTNNSIAISVLSSLDLNGYIEYGITKTRYGSKTSITTIKAGTPSVFELTGLRANTKVYYRLSYKTADSQAVITDKQNSFMTQRNVSSAFSFSVQGDTHPERAGIMFNSDLYYVTMGNIATQQPDFHIMLGDDFSIDPIISKGAANQINVEGIYKTHRNWLNVAGSSVPIYLVNGNHEQAAEYLLDGTLTNPAVLAGNARLKYFPLPAPNSFYTGDTQEVVGVGLPRDYYSWTWGDALFITLDPYWHSKNAVDNVAGAVVPEDKGAVINIAPTGSASPSPSASAMASPTTPKPPSGAQPSPKATKAPAAGGAAAGGNGKTANLWTVGIGDEQYAWLKKTLENSKAKYRFVFAHHVLGTGRGAIEVSTNYEWGGKDPKGISTFAKERPNWELPIHDLMVKNKVSIFFQGHDHIFCTQERDGLIYQSMPNPADDTFSMFNEGAYLSGVKAPNSGHVRVSIAASQAKVEYFLAARPQDTSRKNMQLAHSYVVKPK
jgi:hypothetical protein